jgi:hypothetical protein
MGKIRKAYNKPGSSDVHVDRPLTNIAVAFTQEQDAFVADRVFQVVPVAKQTDAYFTIPRGHFFRDEMELKAPGAEPAEATYDVDTDTYRCDVWALGKGLADEIKANYDNPLQPEREITQFLTLKGLIRKERLFAASFMTTSVWTGDITGVDSATPSTNQVGRWDRADSTPIEDIREGKRRVQARTGYRPNVLTLGREAYDALLDHPDIVGRLDRGQTSGPAIVLRQNLAALFELDEILVMDAIVNTAVEGATDAFSFIGGKSELLTYRPASPGLYVPAAGYTFAWTGLMRAGMEMRRIREEKRRADWFDVAMAFAHKKIAADLGQFYTQIVN